MVQVILPLHHRQTILRSQMPPRHLNQLEILQVNLLVIRPASHPQVQPAVRLVIQVEMKAEAPRHRPVAILEAVEREEPHRAEATPGAARPHRQEAIPEVRRPLLVVATREGPHLLGVILEEVPPVATREAAPLEAILADRLLAVQLEVEQASSGVLSKGRCFRV